MPTEEGCWVSWLEEARQHAGLLTFPLPAFWALLHLPAEPGWHLRSSSTLPRHREKSAPLPRAKQLLPGLQLALALLHTSSVRGFM